MKWASRIAGVTLGAVALTGVAFADGAVSYEIVDGGIPASLTGTPGNPDAGRHTVINRKLGNCLACHVISEVSEQPFHGEVGPPLDGVADRWSEAELRLILVDSKKVFDGTIMPTFHRTDGLNRVSEKFEGKTILSAAEVEDVLAYLMTLKE